MKRLTAYQIKRLNQLSSDKITAREIAGKIRADKNAVYAYMKRNNIPFKLRKKKGNPNEAKDIKPGTYFNWQWAAKVDFAFG